MITKYNHQPAKGTQSIGLRLYGQRLYDGDLGRFLMPDTIIPNLYEPQSMNPYSYCHNDPVNYIDPSGHYRRVPRIFPQGDMPTASTNALMGVLQLLGVILGAAAGAVSGNARLGTGVALSVDLLFNALYPTLLSPDRRTMPRRNLVQRLLMDILFHGVAAFAGFKFSRLSGTRLLPLLIVNSGMLIGGMWSSQLGGLMKSFGMGYNLGRLRPSPGRAEEMCCEGGEDYQQYNREDYEEIRDNNTALQQVSTTDTVTDPVPVPEQHHEQVAGTDRSAYEEIPDANVETQHMPGDSGTGAGYPDDAGPQTTVENQDGDDDVLTIPSLTSDEILHQQQPGPSPEVISMPSPYTAGSGQSQCSFGGSPLELDHSQAPRRHRHPRMAVVLPPPAPAAAAVSSSAAAPPASASSVEQIVIGFVPNTRNVTITDFNITIPGVVYDSSGDPKDGTIRVSLPPGATSSEGKRMVFSVLDSLHDPTAPEPHGEYRLKFRTLPHEVRQMPDSILQITGEVNATRCTAEIETLSLLPPEVRSGSLDANQMLRIQQDTRCEEQAVIMQQGLDQLNEGDQFWQRARKALEQFARKT